MNIKKDLTAEERAEDCAAVLRGFEQCGNCWGDGEIFISAYTASKIKIYGGHATFIRCPTCQGRRYLPKASM
jgi:hypothetical protein